MDIILFVLIWNMTVIYQERHGQCMEYLSWAVPLLDITTLFLSEGLEVWHGRSTWSSHGKSVWYRLISCLLSRSSLLHLGIRKDFVHQLSGRVWVRGFVRDNTCTQTLGCGMWPGRPRDSNWNSITGPTNGGPVFAEGVNSKDHSTSMNRIVWDRNALNS